mmetsp:Transcript_26286/g.73765  ORF Transcript_26286/g.73765 Transcript_26286/m.73765 type:complete len:229 (-) Transcript_26286:97-783(-)
MPKGLQLPALVSGGDWGGNRRTGLLRAPKVVDWRAKSYSELVILVLFRHVLQAVSGGQVLHTFEVTREVDDILGRQHKVRSDSRDDVAAPLHRNQEELLQRPQPCLLDGLPNHGRVLSHLWAATKPLSQPKARIPFWRTAAKAAQRLPPISYLQPHKQLLHRVIRLFGLAAEYLFCQGRQQRRGGYQDVQNPKDRVREAVHRDVKHAKDRHSGVLLGPVCLRGEASSA